MENIDIIEQNRLKHNEYMKKWREENAEHLKKYKKEQYYKHKDKTRKHQKEYYLANREKIRQQQREYGIRYRAEHKEEELNKVKKWQKEHPEKHRENARRSYQKHREKKLLAAKIYRIENPEKFKENKRNYRKTHTKEIKDYMKEYLKTKNGILSKKKHYHKRYRELGFISLNDWEAGTPDSEGHHLDKINVIYIPEELHKSISHNVYTGKNMDTINLRAWDYLEMSVL